MRRRETRLVDVDRNNHLNFLGNDPTDIEVQETEFAGKGLFARRKFTKGELIVSYRGVTKGLQSLTIFTFLTLENQTILGLMPAIILELVGGTLMTSTQHIASIVFPKSFSKKPNKSESSSQQIELSKRVKNFGMTTA